MDTTQSCGCSCTPGTASLPCGCTEGKKETLPYPHRHQHDHPCQPVRPFSCPLGGKQDGSHRHTRSLTASATRMQTPRSSHLQITRSVSMHCVRHSRASMRISSYSIPKGSMSGALREKARSVALNWSAPLNLPILPMLSVTALSSSPSWVPRVFHGRKSCAAPGSKSSTVPSGQPIFPVPENPHGNAGNEKGPVPDRRSACPDTRETRPRGIASHCRGTYPLFHCRPSCSTCGSHGSSCRYCRISYPPPVPPHPGFFDERTYSRHDRCSSRCRSFCVEPLRPGMDERSRCWYGTSRYSGSNCVPCAQFYRLQHVHIKNRVKNEIFRYVPVMAVMAASGVVLGILWDCWAGWR